MKKNIILILTFLLSPIMVFASTKSSSLNFGTALLIEAFVSIHMSCFVLMPISKMLVSEDKSKKLFWTLFIIRAVSLILIDTFNPEIFMLDFILVFIGAFLVVPIMSVATGKKINAGESQTIMNKISKQSITSQMANCPKCGRLINTSNKFCVNCGTEIVKPVIENNFCPNCGSKILPESKFCTSCGQEIKAVELNNVVEQAPKQEAIVDPIYNLNTETLLNNMIDSEMKKQQATGKEVLPSMATRKNRLVIIYSIINLILISLIFFHISWFIPLLVIINILIFSLFIKKYNIKKYIVKEVKARKDEKISYVVSSVLASKIENDSSYQFKKILNYTMIIISLIIPLVVFSKPHFFYEKYNDSYYIRFYTIGLKNPSTIEVPSTYNGKNIVGIRGNVFQNIKSVKKVILPDTINTIRGNAFSGDSNLEEINIPTSLTYLGGGAFRNCLSLKEITIPDSVTEMQGEVFQNCKSLTSVTLSKNITEIRGNSFENCSSLTSIDIPTGVTRIGGHAFYGCSSLSSVIIPNTVTEIGSSAFRMCRSLYSINVPSSALVNERAFKESPTTVTRY